MRLFHLLLGLLIGASNASAVSAQSYLPEPWWPSEFGAEDQIGALNRLTPAKVLSAASLIETGRIFDLGRVFEEDMPLFSLTPKTRKYTLVSQGAPTGGPFGENKLIWNEDYIAGHLGQDGTQFDALAHMGTQLGADGDLGEMRYYNGHRHVDIGSGRGFSKLGVENVTPIFTRGILLDFAALKGGTLECSEEIDVADIKAALERQKLPPDAIRPGDAFLYHTGWGKYWKTDNDKFNSCTPGLSDSAGDWVVAQKVLLVGVDNWGVEAIPNPDPKHFGPNHQKFLVENGIYILENMKFDSLIAAGVYEFAFVVGPLPLKGATGSPIRPFAIR